MYISKDVEDIINDYNKRAVDAASRLTKNLDEISPDEALDSMGAMIKHLAKKEVWHSLARDIEEFRRKNKSPLTVEFLARKIDSLSFKVEGMSRNLESSTCQITNLVQRYRLAATSASAAH